MSLALFLYPSLPVSLFLSLCPSVCHLSCCCSLWHALIMTTLPCQRCRVAMQIQQTVTKCATLSALILADDSDSVSRIFLQLPVAKFPGCVSRSCEIFTIVQSQSQKPKRVTCNIRFLFPFFARLLFLFLCFCFCSFFPHFCFLHISHGGQVKNSVICSPAASPLKYATRSQS